MSNFTLKEEYNHFNANLTSDLGLDAWDINQLIFLVENNFNIQLKNGIENDIVYLNQLVSMVYKEMHKKSLHSNKKNVA